MTVGFVEAMKVEVPSICETVVLGSLEICVDVCKTPLVYRELEVLVIVGVQDTTKVCVISWPETLETSVVVEKRLRKSVASCVDTRTEVLGIRSVAVCVLVIELVTAGNVVLSTDRVEVTTGAVEYTGEPVRTSVTVG